MRASFFMMVGLAACGEPRDVPPPPAMAASPPALVASSERTLRFSFLLMDRVAGGSVVTIHADGSRDATWEFADRGRGPKQATHYEVDAAGLFARVDTSGVDYMKQTVAEHFTNANGVRAWKSDSEQGSAPDGAPATYVTMQGAPDLFAALARALLKSPNHELSLLPAGKARIAKASELTVKNESSSLHVTRYEIEGIDFAPVSIWLDDENELFASADFWASTVRASWEPVAPQLRDVQRAAQSERLGNLARTLAKKPPDGGVAIIHARLFDAATKTIVPDATIVVRGDRIIAVGPSRAIATPKDAMILDAAGKTVIPGLADMHEHISPGDGLLYLAYGVTFARDLGNDMEPTLRTVHAWDAGEEVGPRTQLAGFIDGRGPYQAPTKVFADTIDEGKRDIDLYIDKGYEQVKLYSSLKPELVAPLATYAHAKGLRVSGHVPFGMTAKEAVLAGYDEVQHANFLFLNFLAAKTDDTRTPLRFTRVAEKAADFDFGSDAFLDFEKTLLAHKTVIDPTLIVFESMFTARRGQIDPVVASIADQLPVQVRRGFLNGGLPVPDGMDATYKRSFSQLQKMVKTLFDAGVTVVPGTDGGAGIALQRELVLYEQAGIPARDVLTLATLGAARVARRDKALGSIEKGKLADLAIVDGKPDEHIEDLAKITITMKGGTVYEAANLRAALGMNQRM